MTAGGVGGRARIAVAESRTAFALPLVPRSAVGAYLLRPNALAGHKRWSQLIVAASPCRGIRASMASSALARGSR